MPVDLGRLDRLIARAEAKVAGQKARIALLREQSRDTRHADRLLAMLEDGLTSFRFAKETLVASLRILDEPER